MIRNDLIRYFKEKNTFTRNELLQFYLRSEPKLNKKTFAWRIYNLKRKGVIQEVGRGLYSIYDRKKYSLQLSKISEKTAFYISKNFYKITFCISESNWINEFSNHQFSSNFTIVEVEKDLIESVFFNLKEKFKTVFLKPNEIDIERYISDLNTAIILVPFLTRAPLQHTENKSYNTPTLEKLVVDIFTKSTPYYFLTNSEIIIIIENAFRKYSINQTKLFAYAERRGKKNEIKVFLIENDLIEAVND
jgi:Family of unknown function (DUF6577)